MVQVLPEEVQEETNAIEVVVEFLHGTNLWIRYANIAGNVCC